MQETQVQPLGWGDPREKVMATLSSTLAWKKSHGQRNLAGYSPPGGKESDPTGQLSTGADQHSLHRTQGAWTSKQQGRWHKGWAAGPEPSALCSPIPPTSAKTQRGEATEQAGLPAEALEGRAQWDVSAHTW